MQDCRKIGCTSRAKSTVAGCWAELVAPNIPDASTAINSERFTECLPCYGFGEMRVPPGSPGRSGLVNVIPALLKSP